MALRIRNRIMEGELPLMKNGKSSLPSLKKRLAFRNLWRTVAKEWICTMRMLASGKWLGALHTFLSASGKRGIRNREQPGLLHFFPLIGLPRIRWLEWCWAFIFQS